MSVAVAADPSSETELRQSVRLIQLFIEYSIFQTRFVPRLPEANIEQRQDVGKHVAQKIQDVAALVGDFGFMQQHFARAPQTLQCGFDIVADLRLFGGRPRRVFAFFQQHIKRAMRFQNTQSFGFGRVRGENGFDANARQNGGDLVGTEAFILQLLQNVSPQTALVNDALLAFARATGLRGGVFFDHVEQLKRNCKSLPDARW